MASGTRRESRKKMVDLRRFWAKEPHHSEIIFAEKRYTSIVARVLLLFALR